MQNPYRWQHDAPDRPVDRSTVLSPIVASLQRGLAVKLVGGHGMGKSVLLKQVRAHLETLPEVRVAYVPVPPGTVTLPALVEDVATRLQLPTPPNSSLDRLMQTLAEQGATRLVLLIDEIDQYVLRDGNETRAWLNRLEGLRKAWIDQFAVVIAGGLGLLHVTHVLGSGLLSRAETALARSFDLDELRALAAPLRERGLDTSDELVATLAALSGGNPALATYGLQRLWDAGTATRDVLIDAFASFQQQHRDFIRAVQDGVSHKGMVSAPARVLAVARRTGGPLSQRRLREACAGDDPPVDVPQALQLLEAAGLIHVHGSPLADPVRVHTVSSILELAAEREPAADPIEGIVATVAAASAAIHRFGRDFHGKKDVLPEAVFTSVLAVALASRGWTDVDREAIQAAGYTDLRVRIRDPQIEGHVLVEAKIWPRNDLGAIQQQLDDYRVAATRHGIAVVFGKRSVEGWIEEYEAHCLAGRRFTRLAPPSDVVGHWRVEEVRDDGVTWRTDHFLVHVPKRDGSR